MWADADADLHGQMQMQISMETVILMHGCDCDFFLVGSGDNVLRWIYETSLDFTVRLMMAYKKRLGCQRTARCRHARKALTPVESFVADKRWHCESSTDGWVCMGCVQWPLQNAATYFSDDDELILFFVEGTLLPGG